MTTKSSNILCVIAATTLIATAANSDPLSGSFTFQGQLKMSGVPVTGMADFQFRLYDIESGGMPIDTTGLASVEIINGLFTVELNFGVEAFDGQQRWIEVEVEFPSGEGNWTTLSPRQSVTGVPYALQTRGLFTNAAGQVGVGTIVPQDKLHVAGGVRVDQDLEVTGDVRVSGEYVYATEKTHRLNIPPCGFQRVDPKAADTFIIVGYGYIGDGIPPFAVALNTSVRLPDGATVTGITAYYYDNELTGDLDVTVTLARRPLMSTGGYTMAQATDSTTGTSDEMDSVEDDSVSAALIDNSAYLYEITLFFEQDVVSNDLRFYGCQIEYTLTTVNP